MMAVGDSGRNRISRCSPSAGPLARRGCLESAAVDKVVA
jgi:hypothetical protein